MNYRLPSFDRLSLDLGVAYTGERIARIDNSVEIPARTIVDLGARYRINVAEAPAVIRLQLSNLTNEFGWRVSSGGGFSYEPERRLSMTITADF